MTSSKLLPTKGPKAILAAAIATALSEYFLVDKDSIETNLLQDTQVVLHNVKLRPSSSLEEDDDPTDGWSWKLPHSDYVARVEGSLKKAVFSWHWGSSSSSSTTCTAKNISGVGGWVQDALLQIVGLEITIYISEATTGTTGSSSSSSHDNNSNHNKTKTNESGSTSHIEPSSVKAIAEAAQEHAAGGEIQQQGGIYGYIRKQLQWIVESLTIQVHDFRLVVHLPPSPTSCSSTTNTDTSNANSSNRQITLEVKGESIEIVSLGRRFSGDSRSDSSLEQKIHLQSIVSQIVVNDGDDGVSQHYPLLDSFSYTANACRTKAKRFQTLMKDLYVTGESEGKLQIHLQPLQLSLLGYLAVVMMAPPNEKEEVQVQGDPPQPTSATEEFLDMDLDEYIATDNDDDTPSGNTATTFEFKLAALVLVMDHGRTLEFDQACLEYCVDGTIMKVTASSFNTKDDCDGARMGISGVQFQLTSPMTLKLESIDNFLIPEIVQLMRPILRTKIVKEGDTFSLYADFVEVVLLDGNKSSDAKRAVEKGNQQKLSMERRGDINIAYPFHLSLNRLRLSKEIDRKHQMDWKRIDLYATPNEHGTELALEIGLLENHLLHLEDARIFGISDKPHQINKLHLDVKQAQVTAGHTIQDWQKAFDPKFLTREFENRSSVLSPPQAWKLPSAVCEPIKLNISWKGTGIAVSDTKVTVGAFRGSAETTQNDILAYYAQNCLSRVADFIPNAELLGLNVVDSTVNFLITAISGPLTGLFALGAIDGVKASIATGKKRRHADAGARTHAMDVFRGIAYTLKDTGHSVTSSPINTVRDAASETSVYVKGNKAKFGGAAVGGVCMLAGGALGGPAGAVAGGIAAQIVATKAIHRREQKEANREDE